MISELSSLKEMRSVVELCQSEAGLSEVGLVIAVLNKVQTLLNAFDVEVPRPADAGGIGDVAMPSALLALRAQGRQPHAPRVVSWQHVASMPIE